MYGLFVMVLVQYLPMSKYASIFYLVNYIMSVFEHSLQKLKTHLEDVDINASIIMEVLRIAMEIVEATQLKGEEQTQLCKKLVRTVVVDAPISDEKETLLLNMIDQGILEQTIKLVVHATKGHVDINSGKEVAKICCLPFI
tara:strand:+ start:475 stop:897 length:423 start_codon:yes stop_codon:yes gene_type:complete